MEPKGFEPSSSRCSWGFMREQPTEPHGCNRRTHAAAPRSNSLVVMDGDGGSRTRFLLGANEVLRR